MSLEPELPDSLPASDASETLGADALAAQATDPHAKAGAAHGHGHHGPFHTHCENCGTKLEGPWCHACGQHDFEFHRSFRHVVMEALEAFLHFDGNFLRSTIALLFRPGWLTEQFNAGKRAAQMPPFRLYLFVAFIFFLVMHLADDGHGAGAGGPLSMTVNGLPMEARTEADRQLWARLTRGFSADDWRDAAKVRALSTRMTTLSREVAERVEAGTPSGGSLAPEDVRQIVETVLAEEAPVATTDPAAKADAAAAGDTAVDDEAIPDWVATLASRLSDEHQRRQLVEKFFASVPKILLVCMPVFALLTRVLFRKSRDFVYLKHLVLALHFHTFLYLWILVVKAVGWVAALPGLGLEWFVWLVGLGWVVAYVPWMLRRLFDNRWFKTLVKAALLTSTYGLLVAAAFSTAALLIFLL